MPHCPHCARELDAQAMAGIACPHCNGLLPLGDESLAGKETYELIPGSESDDDVLGDIDLSLDDDDAEATLPFGGTVEFQRPAPASAESSDELSSDEFADKQSSEQSTIDHIKLDDTVETESTDDAEVIDEAPLATDDPSATIDYKPDTTIELEDPVASESSELDSELDDLEEEQNESTLDYYELEESGSADATIDEVAVSDIDSDTDEADPTSTLDYVSDRTVEFDASDPAKHDATIDFDSDKTIDLAESNPELAEKMSSQWAGTIDLGTPQNQTIRQQDEDGEGKPKQRSTVPVKSRTMSEATDSDNVSYIRPSDAPDYELLKQIGAGGMGVVYAARQSSIARTVAVKMLKPGGKEGADQRDKFISEAVVTGELDHPNIVPIYDLGSNDQGALFYSMKHVQGTPWEDVLEEKSLDENLNILLRVADAVAFAHARGVVHRDLKPENVMLGEFGEVLVMDWGLARVTQVFRSAGAIHQTGSLGGTPAYMSPEMARGPVEVINHTSDIYLLGAILYELIGGRPPHSGRDVMQCLMSAAQNAIDPIDYVGELRDVALRAMATEQSDRYQSVKEFQEAVRTYLSHSESVVLASHAEHRLADARLQKDYQLFARAMYGFDESLALWSDNTKARELHETTVLEYAGLALANGDLDLAKSLLDQANPAHEDLLTQIRKAEKERNSRQSLLKWSKRAVAALLVAIVGLGTYSYIEIAKGRKEALTQRDEAKRQEGIAKDNEKIAIQKEKEANESAALAAMKAKEAEEARDDADQKRIEAEEAKERERKQKELANDARARAEASEKDAIIAKQTAEDAEDAKEYEAYVAGIGLAAAKIDENAYDFAQQLLDASPAERRDWEWGRLGYLCQLSAAVYDLGAPVDAVAYSPDGQLIATGDRGGKLTVRHADSGDVAFDSDIGQYVYSVAFSPNGQYLAAGSADGKIRIFGSADGRLLRTLEGHQDGVLDVDFSSDSRQLVSASYDNTARVWDLASGKSIDTLSGHNWWVWSARFSPDAARIVTASQDSNAIVWQRDNSGSYQPTSYFTDHEGPVYAAAFSASGDRVATGGYDKTIRVWQPDQVGELDLAAELQSTTEDDSAAVVLTGHEAAVRSVAFGPAGQTLLSGSHDNTLRLWNLGEAVELKALRGHGSRVESVALGPEGKFAASGSQDGTLRVWDVDGYVESQTLGSKTLAGHADAVLAARFAADGRVLTASRDRTAKLWDAEGNELAKFAQGHEYLASTAVFFDAGRKLATGAGDNTVRIWNVGTGAELQVLRGTGRVGTVAVDPSGQWLATGGANNLVRWWDLASGEQLASLEGHEAEVTAAAFHPELALLATGDDRGEIRLWQFDGQQASLKEALRGHNGTVTELEFGPTGELLYSASGDNTCSAWNVATGDEVPDAMLSHPDWVAAMDVSADGRVAVTACEDGHTRVWDLDAGKVVADASLDSGSATGVALSPDGHQVLVTSSENRSVWVWNYSAAPKANLSQLQPIVTTRAAGTLWTAKFSPAGNRFVTIGGNDARMVDLATGEAGVRFSPHGAVAAVAITRDGRLVATGSWDGTAKLWDTTTKQVVHQLVGGHSGYINSIDFSPDGSMVATASDDGTVRLWSTQSGEVLPMAFKGHTGRVHSVRFSPDGQQLLTTSSDRTARLWDTDSVQTLHVLTGHQWGVLCGAFSSDGQYVATGSEDNTAKLWNTATGALERTMSGHTSAVTGVALTPDGRRLLTASQDTTAKLWDTETGGEILTLSGHNQDLTSVDFTTDGRTALSASRDGTAVLWPTIDWHAGALE